MKSAILSLAGFSLVQLTLAQPFNRHNAHRAIHDKRNLVTVIDTVVVEATEIPEVIIYVSTDGTPLSTTTEYLDNEPTTIYQSNPSVATSSVATTTTPVVDVQAAAAVAVQPSTPTTAAAVSTTAAQVPSVEVSVAASIAVSVAYTSAAAPVAATSTSAAAPVVSSSSSAAVVSIPVSSSSSATSSAAAASTSAVAASSGGYGFAYSPYMANNACKTQDQVNEDFAAIPSSYSTVRIYGTDCNQVATTLVAAKKYGFKIFAGVYDFAEVSSETQAIVDAVDGDWSLITTISIGNEWVNNGVTDAAGVASAVATAKSILSAANYPGKVVAVDTLAATKLYPSLCDNVDYCAVNCHPFFDTNTAADAAGTFLSSQISELRALLSNPDMDIVITETGWPSAGTSHDQAVASPDAQTTAMAAIKDLFASNASNVFLFSTFNDYWKVNTAALYMAEQSWGYLGNSPSDVAAGLV
ncbi:putative cell wall glucanase protein [Botrytis fragariae]|uniref:Putative cell wall glucanase protein n=1 Tax=Botrytis fragariae TaxID=1964551 RepID=A0A8H6AZF4_9HELO|nr:putative cell wall glucanase protein [Botrytis fragariae]KAF5876549.1 putative cell wall glucanase protein [Botrytis fragariae]